MVEFILKILRILRTRKMKMCSIIGSFDKGKFKKLVNLNQFRGNFSYSISLFDIKLQEITYTSKSFGSFDFDKLNRLDTKNCYIIGHVQAPTGGMIQDVNRIHPTEIQGSKLWHNGIITPRGIKELKKTFTFSDFDTELLHYGVYTHGYEELSNIEGLFSCLYYNKTFKIFRTKHGKLYVDDDLNLSSERFEGSKCINYDTVYELHMVDKKINKIDEFKTKRFNVVINGEF